MLNMYVNIAWQKKNQSGSLAYEGTTYSMENLADTLKNKFMENNSFFNANLFWFVAELLDINGYGYYVNLFYKYAVKSYDIGILALVAFCCYDVSIMHIPFAKKTTDSIMKTDFAHKLFNSHVVFDTSLSEASNCILVYKKLLNEIDKYNEIFNAVIAFMHDDIHKEELIMSDIIAQQASQNSYIEIKKEYINNHINICKKSIKLHENNLKIAIQYYVKITENFAEIAANRFIKSFWNSVSSSPFMQKDEYENYFAADDAIEKNSKVADFFALSSVQFDKLVETIYAPTRISEQIVFQKDERSYKDIFFSINIQEGKILFYLEKNSRQKESLFLSSVNLVNEIEWWQQSGQWGQWVYVYTKNDKLIQKFEIQFTKGNHQKHLFAVERIWHLYVDFDIETIELNDKYVALKVKNNVTVLYPNDLRYVFAENQLLYKRISEIMPRKIMQRLTKWTSQ